MDPENPTKKISKRRSGSEKLDAALDDSSSGEGNSSSAEKDHSTTGRQGQDIVKKLITKHAHEAKHKGYGQKHTQSMLFAFCFLLDGFAFCFLLDVLCSLLFALCSLLYVSCFLLFVPCSLLSALCSLFSVFCFTLTDLCLLLSIYYPLHLLPDVCLLACLLVCLLLSSLHNFVFTLHALPSVYATSVTMLSGRLHFSSGA
jgi:hypothetical protein